MSGIYEDDPLPVVMVPDDPSQGNYLYGRPLPVYVTNPSEGGGGGGGGELPARLAAKVTLLTEMDPTTITDSGWYGSNTLGGPFAGMTDPNGYLLQVIASSNHVVQFLYLPGGVDTDSGNTINSLVYRREKVGSNGWAGFTPVIDAKGAQDNVARGLITDLQNGSLPARVTTAVNIDGDDLDALANLTESGWAYGQPLNSPFGNSALFLEQIVLDGYALQRATYVLDNSMKQRVKLNSWSAWRDL